MIRLLAALPAVLLCLWGAWHAGAEGVSRLLSQYAGVSGDVPASVRAASLTPDDPEAHFARGLVSTNAGALEEAVRDYERAVALRPRDYYLWFMLAEARDQAGNQDGALAASGEAVRLAPYYAQPRWQHGNLLFRAGRMDEAFAELRRAAESDPALLPAIIDLAWGGSGQDVQAVKTLIQPQTPAEEWALARFFARHGRSGEAIRFYREQGTVPDKEWRALLTDLLVARKYRDAYDIWLTSHSPLSLSSERGEIDWTLTDGGFEQPLSLDDPGFGWQLSREATNVSMSVDVAEHKEGARSLRLEWKGDFNPSAGIISQLLIVKPKSRYRLRFYTRTQELVSGSLPIISIADTSDAIQRVLAQSKPLPQGTSGWSEQAVEFTTGEKTEAVLMFLQRQPCNGPCPIFGLLWLDGFSLERI